MSPMRPKTYPNDLQLAQRAAEGDTAAWDELIRLYGRRIFNVAFQFVGSGPEAEDLTQEIFLKLYRRLDRYRGDVPLVAWMLTLSRNLCIEQYRRQRLERRWTRVCDEVLERLPAEDDPSRAAERKQQLGAVYEALGSMTEDLAVVVQMRDLQGLSYEEVAGFLGVPMGTLKSRLVRARRQLAQRVERSLQPPLGRMGGSGMLNAAEAGP